MAAVQRAMSVRQRCQARHRTTSVADSLLYRCRCNPHHVIASGDLHSQDDEQGVRAGHRLSVGIQLQSLYHVQPRGNLTPRRFSAESTTANRVHPSNLIRLLRAQLHSAVDHGN